MLLKCMEWSIWVVIRVGALDLVSGDDLVMLVWPVWV